jgi:nitrogen fixation protein NifB
MVTQHFGRATVFHVFDRVDEAWHLAESRENDPSCRPEGEQSDAHDSLLAYSADLVADCDAVLAARIGPGAVQRLADRGVEAYAMHALIEEALSALAEEIEGQLAEQADSADAGEGDSSDVTTTAITGQPETDRQE